MGLYIAYNGPAPTTASQLAVTTGTSIKTLMQLKPGANSPLKIVEWGISFDGAALAAGIECELVETGTVFATVTQYAAADVQPYDDPNLPASTVSLGTSASGYTSTAEGTITATRVFDAEFVLPTGGYSKQFPLGREPQVKVSSALRVRVKAAAAVNAICYVVWQE